MPQQITNNFIINLDVWSPDHKLGLFILTTLNIFEYVSNSSWNYSSLLIMQIMAKPLHCICLASTSLTVRKYSCIITLQCWADRQSSSGIINLFLTGFIVKNMVKSELVFEVVGWIVNISFKIIRIERIKMVVLEKLYSFSIVMNLDSRDKNFTSKFPVKGRTDSDYNSYIVIRLHFTFSHF